MGDTTPYRLVTVPTARRALKKLPVPVRRHLIQAVAVLETNPQLGEPLEAPWWSLRSFHFIYRRTQYRVLYGIDVRRRGVIVYHAATRENFHRSLRQLKLRPTGQGQRRGGR